MDDYTPEEMELLDMICEELEDDSYEEEFEDYMDEWLDNDEEIPF